MVSVISNLAASFSASIRLSSLESCSGSMIAVTLFGPKALADNAMQIEESIPPLIPITAPLRCNVLATSVFNFEMISLQTISMFSICKISFEKGLRVVFIINSFAR